MPYDPRNEPPGLRRDGDDEDAQIERDFEHGRRAEPDDRVVPPQGRFTERRSWWARTGDEISAWFGDREAMRRRQWDEAVGDHRGKGPKLLHHTDTRIIEEINERLTDDPDLDASQIVVAVADGEVTLDGSVTTKADKRLAEDIAESARGVLEVRNNLRIG